MEHDEQADDLEAKADRLEQRSDELGETIDETEADWERKKKDESVPGAVPDEEADRNGPAGGGGETT